jgi:opacity protein-like surface antigen
MKILNKSIFVIFISLSVSSFANSLDIYAPQLEEPKQKAKTEKLMGLYLTGAYQYNLYQISSQPGVAEDINGNGFQVGIGYLFNANGNNQFGLEVTYSYMGSVSLTNNTGTFSQNDITLNTINLMGRYQYHFDMGFVLFLNGGIANTFAISEVSGANSGRSTEYRFMPVVGGGLGQFVSDHVLLKFQIDHYFGADPDKAFEGSNDIPSNNQFTFGVSYIF